MPKSEPEFIVYAGPMFGGKTRSLFNHASECLYLDIPFQFFKPAFDDRYSQTEVMDHTGRIRFPATSVPDSSQIIPNLDSRTKVVLIDEAMFFDSDLPSICTKIHDAGHDVYVSTLDMTAERVAFPYRVQKNGGNHTIGTLFAVAKHVEKIPGKCQYPIHGHICQDDAWYSRSIIPKTEAVQKGGADQYICTCDAHFNTPLMEPQIKYIAERARRLKVLREYNLTLPPTKLVWDESLEKRAETK
ncbi:MAG TPA: hypothetical protein VK158_01125 [Acidobacteriota bacterium]|nr:hypothetical protein [Acidobacteriota bacterium]